MAAFIWEVSAPPVGQFPAEVLHLVDAKKCVAVGKISPVSTNAC